MHEGFVVPMADAPEPALTGPLDECLMPLFRHTDIKGEGEMLRMRDPAHFLVVPEAAVTAVDDEGLAPHVAEPLERVHALLVHDDLPAAFAGDLLRGEVRPFPGPTGFGVVHEKTLLSLVRSVARGFGPVGLVRGWWASGEGLVGG